MNGRLVPRWVLAVAIVYHTMAIAAMLAIAGAVAIFLIDGRSRVGAPRWLDAAVEAFVVCYAIVLGSWGIVILWLLRQALSHRRAAGWLGLLRQGRTYWMAAKVSIPLFGLWALADACRGIDRAHGTAVCPGCGYHLRATPGRCPECGRVAE